MLTDENNALRQGSSDLDRQVSLAIYLSSLRVCFSLHEEDGPHRANGSQQKARHDVAGPVHAQIGSRPSRRQGVGQSVPIPARPFCRGIGCPRFESIGPIQ